VIGHGFSGDLMEQKIPSVRVVKGMFHRSLASGRTSLRSSFGRIWSDLVGFTLVISPKPIESTVIAKTVFACKKCSTGIVRPMRTSLRSGFWFDLVGFTLIGR
jgi:hypothetical protein